MVKHTKTVRRQQPTNCLSVFDYLVKLALKGLISFVKVAKERFIKYFGYDENILVEDNFSFKLSLPALWTKLT